MLYVWSCSEDRKVKEKILEKYIKKGGVWVTIETCVNINVRQNTEHC